MRYEEKKKTHTHMVVPLLYEHACVRIWVTLQFSGKTFFWLCVRIKVTLQFPGKTWFWWIRKTRLPTVVSLGNVDGACQLSVLHSQGPYFRSRTTTIIAHEESLTFWKVFTFFLPRLSKLVVYVWDQTPRLRTVGSRETWRGDQLSVSSSITAAVYTHISRTLAIH